MSTLEDLVIRAQSGDEDAYAAIVRQFQDKALAYAYSILEDQGLAEDARQEAFVCAYVDLLSLRNPSAFPAWFREIVKRRSISFKRGWRSLTVPFDDALEVPSEQPCPRRIAQRNETQQTVQEAVERLPEEEKKAIQLFYFDDLSLEEIGRLTGVPSKTVKSRLHAGRARLRQELMEVTKGTVLKQSRAGDKKPLKYAASEAILQFEAETARLLRFPTEEEQKRAGDILCAKGRLHRLLGQMKEALDAFEQGMAIQALWKEALWRSRFRAEIGLTLIQMGDYVKAEKQLEASRTAIQYSEDRGCLLAAVLNGLGMCAWGKGDFRKARLLYEQALAECGSASCGALEAEVSNNLALLDWKAGCLTDALRHFRMCMNKWKKLRNRYGMALTLMNIGIVEENLGKFADARRHYNESLGLAEELGFIQLQSATCSNIGNLALSHGRWKEAIEFNSRALELARQAKDRRSEAIALENLALANLGMKKLDQATASLESALSVAEAIADEERLLSLDLVEIEMLLNNGSVAQAEEKLETAACTIHAKEFTCELPRLLRLKINAEVSTGRLKEARASFREAMQACREQKNASEMRRIRSLEKSITEAKRKHKEGIA